MKTPIVIIEEDCPKCESKKSVLVTITESTKNISVDIGKCSQCNKQIYMKELNDFMRGCAEARKEITKRTV